MASAPQLPQQSENKSSGKAVGALVCGICSLLIGTWCCMLWLPLGIVAMVLGKGEEKAIAQGRASAAGKSLAQWGFWLGFASIVIGVILVIIFAVFGVFSSVFEEYLQNL